MQSFFYGERIVDNYIRFFYSGKAQLNCTIIDRWDVEISQPLRCGTKYEHDFKHSVGMNLTERQELESIITGTLGLEGIAEFKSEIRGKTGLEIGFEEIHEEVKRFEIQAPKCGSFTLLMYQLKRLYRFSYKDQRFFHHDEWNRTLTEATDHFHDDSKQTRNDPRCDCDPQPNTGFDGMVYLAGENFSTLQGYIQYPGRIEFPLLKTGINAEDISHIMFREVIIDRRAIPPYLRFLAHIDEPKTYGRFFPFSREGFLEQDISYNASRQNMREHALPVEHTTSEQRFEELLSHHEQQQEPRIKP